MTFALLFWFLMILWALAFWKFTDKWPSNIVLFVLLGLLGWKVFGPALHQ